MNEKELAKVEEDVKELEKMWDYSLAHALKDGDVGIERLWTDIVLDEIICNSEELKELMGPTCLEKYEEHMRLRDVALHELKHLIASFGFPRIHNIDPLCEKVLVEKLKRYRADHCEKN